MLGGARRAPKTENGIAEAPTHLGVAEALSKQDLIFRDTFPDVIGVRILEAGPGRAVGVIDVDGRARHPGGYAHGGALAGFGDTVAAWATFPILGLKQVFSTIEFKANFVSSVSEGRLRAEAVEIHQDERTVVLHVKIATDNGRLVAIMLVTQAILSAT